MKNMKKLAGLMLALIMALALTVPAFAETTKHTITITPPADTPDTVTNEYKVYKVFDAVGNDAGAMSYKVIAGNTNEVPDCFEVDAAGNVKYVGVGTDGKLTDEETKAIATYVANQSPVATATSTGSSKAVADVKDYGYYYITTSNGTAVTVTSTNPDVEVNDKNEVPTVDKVQTVPDSIKVGDSIEYTITIAVKKGAENYVLHDTMEEGLKLPENPTFTVKVDGAAVDASNNTYTVKTTDLTDDCAFEIAFDDTYIAGLVGKNIVVEYSAVITDTANIPSDTVVTNIKNSAKLTYGDNGETPPSEQKETLFKFDLVKTTDLKDDKYEILKGAEFELYTADHVKQEDGKWILNEGVSSADAIKFKVVDGAYKVSTANDATATILVTEGMVTVAGLKGTYYLKETKAPDGYNLLTSLQQIVISKNEEATVDMNEGIYTSGGIQVINNAGSTLPDTGGIGTTIFYTVGGILVVGAAILLVTRKRMKSEM